MQDYTIITNHVPRLIVDAYELTAKEREEFDYMDWPAIERGEDSAEFIRYKGQILDLGEFLAEASGGNNVFGCDWAGYLSDSFFSGMLVRFCPDGDHVIMGRYYC